ncbi:hypothetical protein C8Q77DRAFT_1111654 [Trametes polyzona]|nr:hypothetical protein C8Q77DRAFT_1111654 [Trametes polyzona]
MTAATPTQTMDAPTSNSATVVSRTTILLSVQHLHALEPSASPTNQGTGAPVSLTSSKSALSSSTMAPSPSTSTDPSALPPPIRITTTRSNIHGSSTQLSSSSTDSQQISSTTVATVRSSSTTPTPKSTTSSSTDATDVTKPSSLSVSSTSSTLSSSTSALPSSSSPLPSSSSAVSSPSSTVSSSSSSVLSPSSAVAKPILGHKINPGLDKAVEPSNVTPAPAPASPVPSSSAPTPGTIVSLGDSASALPRITPNDPSPDQSVTSVVSSLSLPTQTPLSDQTTSSPSRSSTAVAETVLPPPNTEIASHTASPVSSAISSPVVNASHSSAGSRLSSGDIAAVCLSVGGAICIALLFFFVRRARRKHRNRAQYRSTDSIYGESIIGLRTSSDGTSVTDSMEKRESATATMNVRASGTSYGFPLPPSYTSCAYAPSGSPLPPSYTSNAMHSASSLTVVIPTRPSISPHASNRNSAVSRDSIPLPSAAYVENAVERAEWPDAWHMPRASSELMHSSDMSQASPAEGGGGDVSSNHREGGSRQVWMAS